MPQKISIPRCLFSLACWWRRPGIAGQRHGWSDANRITVLAVAQPEAAREQGRPKVASSAAAATLVNGRRSQ